MNFNNVGSIWGNAYQYANKAQKTTVNSTSFTKSLQRAAESGAGTVEAYKEYLESKYGSVMVKSVGKDQSSMDSLGASTSGTGNIVIAPNILEEMANNSEKAAYYEEKIQYFLDSVPKYQAELSAMGHEIHSCGIVIHPDGTVTHYISGDLKPEVRAKIEAQVKAEQEEKLNRRKKYQELSQEVAEKRKLEMEIADKKQSMVEALASRLADTSRFTYTATSEVMNSAVAAYEKNIIDAVGILK